MNQTIYADYSDAELFQRIQGGQTPDVERAFNELYARYSPRIYAYCLRVLGDRDQARDVFQDAFVRFYKSAQQERSMTNVAGFLLTIARNLCLNHKRDTRPTTPIDSLELPAPQHGVSYEEDELLRLITLALDLLDAEHREAFVLREYDGLSFSEIGELTGTNEATAKTRAFRAKQKIRQILSPYLQDLERS
jgi:RNA polymerase sigma-70 factor (ECF subfamily)